MTWKRATLLVLLAWLATLAPWRLAALGAEVLIVRQGQARTDPGNGKYWLAQDLEARLNALGWRIDYVTPLRMRGEAAYGITIPAEHAILIESSLAWNARYAALAHEAGHATQPAWIGEIDAEFFAESVAALVAGDGPREHARWLAGHRADCVLFLLTQWRPVYDAAALLGD